MESQEVIKILKALPDYRLRLIEYAQLVTDEDGDIDEEKANFYALELEEAISEAEEYAKATKDAVQCLKRLALS